MNIENLSPEQIKWLAEEAHCPDACGFEGIETYPGCQECLICQCKLAKHSPKCHATPNSWEWCWMCEKIYEMNERKEQMVKEVSPPVWKKMTFEENFPSLKLTENVCDRNILVDYYAEDKLVLNGNLKEYCEVFLDKNLVLEEWLKVKHAMRHELEAEYGGCQWMKEWDEFEENLGLNGRTP